MLWLCLASLQMKHDWMCELDRYPFWIVRPLRLANVTLSLFRINMHTHASIRASNARMITSANVPMISSFIALVSTDCLYLFISLNPWFTSAFFCELYTEECCKFSIFVFWINNCCWFEIGWFDICHLLTKTPIIMLGITHVLKKSCACLFHAAINPFHLETRVSLLFFSFYENFVSLVYHSHGGCQTLSSFGFYFVYRSSEIPYLRTILRRGLSGFVVFSSCHGFLFYPISLSFFATHSWPSVRISML